MKEQLRQKDLQNYPVTGMQEGMLFHSMSNPASGVDIEQIVFNLSESLNVDFFVQSWREVVKR
jgi:hypothetical protein